MKAESTQPYINADGDIVLTPSYILTRHHPASRYGMPVLVNQQTGDAFGPGDVFQPYPSWGWLVGFAVVQRMVAGCRDAEIIEAVNRFCSQMPDAPKLGVTP